MSKTIKDQIIQTLGKFEEVHYNNLYQFLSYDERAKPFDCLSGNLDANFSLKNEYYPTYIYNTLCDNSITLWNIDSQLLLDIITGNKPTIMKI